MRRLPNVRYGMLTAACVMLLPAPAVATPWGRHGPGVVSVIEGAPAICVPAGAKKNFSVESVWLIHESRAGAKRVWSINALPASQRFVLRPGQCLLHGTDLAGYTQDVPPTALTEVGRYTFQLHAVAVKRSDLIGYSGSFCLRSRGSMC